MEGQLCALGVREEYERLGVDAQAIQRRSILRTGAKMLLVDVYKIPVLWSLGVVALILGTTVALSLARPARPATDG